MHKRDYSKAVFLVLFFLLIAVRVFALFFVESITYPQTWEYEGMANNFLDGKGFYYSTLGAEYRSTAIMLYSLICAIIYYVTKHSYLAVKIFQILLSVFNCFLVYRISKRLFGKVIGLIAFALVGLHPGLIIYSIKLHSLTLDTLLFTLFIYFLLLVAEGQKIFKNSFLAGLSIGAALLTRPTIGLFIPFALIIIFLKAKESKVRPLRLILCISTGILLILSPLLIRNYFIFHKVVILPSDSGLNFWKGNNPNSIFY